MLKNREEITDVRAGVGLVHSRENRSGNIMETHKRVGALEGTNSCTECNKETSSNHRKGEGTGTKLLQITRVSEVDSSYRFKSLASLLNEEYLLDCFRELKRNKASGVDGVSVQEYERGLKENIRELISRMKSMSYRPQAVKRAYIPKGNGELRALGIPAVEDKLVQKAAAKILWESIPLGEAIYEPGFIRTSYGFRKGKSPHDALREVEESAGRKPVNYVIDADIKGFFDNVDHKWMIKFLEHRIEDRNLIRLIVRMLKSGIMEEGKYWEADKGTPQGGIISPVLSNIYLHYVLDLWIERRMKKESKGYIEMIRYADDFIIFCEKEEEARAILKALEERLEKFGLTLSKEKTKIVKFGRKASREEKGNTFDFLGFTHFNDKTMKGWYKVGRKTSKKKFGIKMKNMHKWIKTVRCKLSPKEIWRVMKLKLIGHYRYYGVSGNYRMIAMYFYNVKRKLYYWLNRRSQKQSFSRKSFDRYLNKYPLPSPRIYVSMYRNSA